MRYASMFTVIDLLREDGIEPWNRVAWEVGAAVRDLFIRHYGASPEKALRRKTHGPGSHCFACYPGWFKTEAVAEMRRVIGTLQAIKTAQGSLF